MSHSHTHATRCHNTRHTARQRQRQNQSGFSLVEVTIAIAIIGVLMAGTLMILNSMREARLTLDTKRKMEVISDALSVYAQTHNRLPCPAHPVHQDVSDGTTTQAMITGDERKITGVNAADINRAGNCFDNNVTSHGFVPYRALGLDEYYARDGWGNHFTFVISPVFARYNFLNAADTTANRSAIHYASNSPETSLIPKIRFCHTMPNVPQATGAGAPHDTSTDARDFLYRDDTITAVERFPFSRNSAPHTVLAANLPDRLFAFDHAAGDNEHTRGIAFALISHGQNGQGAYRVNETVNKSAFSSARLAEQRNAQLGVNDTNPNQVFALETAYQGALDTQFDDIVVTMTQDQVYARKGAQSCVIP